MASEKQRAAARRNVRKAQAGAKSKQTLKHLPKQTKTALGKEANKVRSGEAKDTRAAQRRGSEAEYSWALADGQDRASPSRIEGALSPELGAPSGANIYTRSTEGEADGRGNRKHHRDR